MHPQGLPLRQALERFSDREDWAEFVALEPYRITMVILGRPVTEYERLHARHRQVEARLKGAFLGRLMDGSLVATGYVWPVRLDAERDVIPPARWRLLTPDFDASEATGGGLRIVDIEVHEPAMVADSSAGPQGGERGARDHVTVAQLRGQLRGWLQREARQHGTRWQKKHYRDAARERFGDHLSDNLFREIWRAADLPDALRRPGLRKRSR